MKKRKVDMKMITVNAMGDNCPIPVIKTKKAKVKNSDRMYL